MVKCSKCGFLASRNVQTRRLEETELEIRKEGALSIAWNTEKPFTKYEPPICFMQSPDFKALPYSTESIYQRDKQSKEVYDEIQRDRECKFFTEWRQGFTPKEHQEMLDRELMMKRDEARRKEEKRWHIVEIILIVVLSGLFTLLGAFIGRGGL